MLIPGADTHFSGHLLTGHYQWFIRKLSVLLCAKTDLAYDIGAHVGFWAVDLAETFGQVKAFEPEGINYGCLVLNVPENVQTYNVAVGSAEGLCGLHNPAPENSGAWEVCQGYSTRVVSLDTHSLDDCPDYIKIDCQGYEEEVLLGASDLIRRSRPVLVVEQIMNGKINGKIHDILSGFGCVEYLVMGKDAVWCWPDKVPHETRRWLIKFNNVKMLADNIPTRRDLGLC